jgi:hypothetical protein
MAMVYAAQDRLGEAQDELESGLGENAYPTA